jgi:thiamine kinase-like enzyme
MTMDGPDRSVDPGDLGRMVAALHRAGGRVTGDIHPWYAEPVGVQGWNQLVAELRHADAPFSADLAGLVDELLAAELILTPPAGPLTLCHRDLWADNVRRVPGNGLAVIDWDNCGPESADQELSMLFVEFGGSRERVRMLYQAYCTADGPGRVRFVSDFTMPVAVLGHLGEQACRQWLQAVNEKDRLRAHRRVREFLAEPLTRDAIGQMLSWLN